MKKIREIFRIIVVPIIMGIMIVITYSFMVISYPEDSFFSSYQSIIQEKYDNLIKEDRPKIIIVSGSSAGFGINEKLLRENTGYEIVNLGLHAGFGGRFNTELAKANINVGDIVLLGYEYGWHEEEYFNTLGVDLVMSGIDTKLEMYRHIPLKFWPQIIGYIPTYCQKKANVVEATGVYSRSSFDDNGQMTLERQFVMDDYDKNIEMYGYVDLKEVDISTESIGYLQGFKEYVRSKGAELYFISPPLYRKAQKSDNRSFERLAEKTEEEIGIEYISNPLDYLFEEKYIFDTIYHCSSEGEIKRTELLIEDLKRCNVLYKTD